MLPYLIYNKFGLIYNKFGLIYNKSGLIYNKFGLDSENPQLEYKKPGPESKGRSGASGLLISGASNFIPGLPADQFPGSNLAQPMDPSISMGLKRRL